MESFISHIEQAAQGFRNSLSPDMVQHWNNKINRIPVIEEQISGIKAHSDKVDTLVTELELVKSKTTELLRTVEETDILSVRLAVADERIGRIGAVVDRAFTWIWGIIASIVVLGIGILTK